MVKHLEGSCGPVQQRRTSSFSGQALTVCEVDELADGLPVEVLDAGGAGSPQWGWNLRNPPVDLGDQAVNWARLMRC